MPVCLGDIQSRPLRPLPAVCCSATTSVPSGHPLSASSLASALVEPVVLWCEYCAVPMNLLVVNG